MYADQLNKGISGAKRASYHAGEARSVAAEFVTANPQMSTDSLPAAFAKHLIDEDDRDTIGYIIEWWMANEVARLLPTLRPEIGKAKVQERVEAKRKAFVEIEAQTRRFVAEIEHKTEAVIERRALRVLDTVLSNGVALRDSTVAEVREHGKQVAGLVAAVSGQAPNALIRDVLTKQQLAAM